MNGHEARLTPACEFIGAPELRFDFGALAPGQASAEKAARAAVTVRCAAGLRYRLRVTASDAFANALGEALTATATSEPFTVDNTAPTWTALSGQGARIEGSATDALSPIIRLEVAVDDGDWRSVVPEGGLADSREARFRVTLPALAPGEHLVSMRAVDQSGNSATRAVSVQVPRPR